MTALRLASLAVLVVGTALQVNAAPALVTFDSPTGDPNATVFVVNSGSTISFQFGASLTFPDIVVEYQLNFDPSIVFSSAVVNGGQITGGICDGICQLSNFSDNVLGFQRLGIIDVSQIFGDPITLLAGGATTFDLAVVTFQAVGPVGWFTAVTIEPVFGSPVNGGEVLFYILVPEPGIGALLGVAFGALALRRRGPDRRG